jgi:hypothetical protein
MNASFLTRPELLTSRMRPAGPNPPRGKTLKRAAFAAAAAGAALLTLGSAGAGAASATVAGAHHAPPVISTTNQAGYVTSGRWFRYISSTVKVPTLPAQPGNGSYAEVVLGGAGVTPVTLAVKAGGGPASIAWSIGVPPFGMGGGAMTKVTPQPGDMLNLSIYYNRHGTDFLTATDITQGTSQTMSLPVPYTVYTAAEAAGVVQNATVVAPEASIRLWAFSGTRVTTYTGVHGSLLGPWTTSRVVDTNTGGSSGAVVISPSALWNIGQNFGVWLRPTA